MPPAIKKMGKAKGPAFVDNLSHASPVKKSTLPILVLIVLGGGAVIWFLYTRSQNAANTAGSSTGAAVSVGAGASGSGVDQSSIDNLTQAVLAMQGQVANNSPLPGGGTSTPITTTPSQTSPAAIAQTSQVTTTSGGPTPRQNGIPVSAYPSGTVEWSLTPAESAALLGGGKPIDFVAQAKAVGASAPAYNTQAANDWTNLLYDRLAILSNYYSNSYTGTSPSAGNTSLGKAIQTTQQQIYNWVNGANVNNGVPIPYNQFIANEGVYVNASPAVQKLITSAAPSGAPTANSLGVYQAGTGTAAYIKSLVTGTAQGSVKTTGGGSSSGSAPLTLAQFDAANRASIIDRGSGNVSTAGINVTVRNDYAKYLAGSA